MSQSFKTLRSFLIMEMHHERDKSNDHVDENETGMMSRDCRALSGVIVGGVRSSLVR